MGKSGLSRRTARSSNMSKQMTGAEMVVEALKDQGVEVLFGYPGGAVLPIYDAIFHQNKLRHVLVRQEQGAAHAAEGYARSTGKVGVLLVTSGPGATNAITGLTDALCDSIPLVCITGQVPTHLIGSDAFQECDTTGITRSCTKHNYLVRRVEDLPRILHEAFYIASHGRPGPVVIDIPKDVQFASGLYTFQKNVQHKTYQPQLKGDLERVRHAVEMMAAAKKPVFYSGGGVINSCPHAFSPKSRKIHIDIDPSSINKNVKVDLGIVGDCAHVLEDMVRLWRAGPHQSEAAALAKWWSAIDGWRARNSFGFRNSEKIIKPQHAVRRLYELTKGRDTYITTEVGQHQMWAAQHFAFEEPNRWMTSGGLGTMGYGLPAAIGAQLAHPKSLVIDIAGEASILMNMQEMSTAG